MDSLKIIACFVIGLGCGLFSLIPASFPVDDFSVYALYALLFLVGIGMGGSRETWEMLRQTNAKILLVPAGVIAGSLGGAAVMAFFLPGISPLEGMAVGAGFGYYSLSSILITKIAGGTLGVVALLSNITREILTLLLAPFLVRRFGKLAAISAGGATSMDTTLPVIVKFSGQEYAVISLFSGVVLTLLTPVIVTAVLAL